MPAECRAFSMVELRPSPNATVSHELVRLMANGNRFRDTLGLRWKTSSLQIALVASMYGCSKLAPAASWLGAWDQEDELPSLNEPPCMAVHSTESTSGGHRPVLS